MSTSNQADSVLLALLVVGVQVDAEVRRGVAALETWLAAQRRTAP